MTLADKRDANSSDKRRGRARPNARRPLAAAMLCAATLIQAGGIAPDGTTATGVTTGATGRPSITVAPPTGGGVSYNAYRDFNVGKSGVDFLNGSARARLIVNEVSGTNPSLIEGEVAVLGPRANFILANQNGITVNGGRFINMGTLALSTGRVSFVDFQSAPGFVQRNVVLDTSIGTLAIGHEGLSGSFSGLELIAKRLTVGGRVENAFTNANARMRAVVGDSHAEFDTSISPTDNLSTFVRYSAPAMDNPEAIAVDITPLGSLLAGRIELIVTDRGAGVRHAGGAYANVGDFIVSASGDLRVEGGRIEAARDIHIDTPRTSAASRADAANEFVAGRNIEVLSRDVSIHGGSIRAGTQTTPGSLTLGLSGENASGAMRLGGVTGPLSVIASGGIGIFGKGQPVVIHGATLAAEQNIVVEGASLALSAMAFNDRSNKSSLASSRGSVVMDMSDGVTLRASEVTAAQDIRLSAASLALDHEPSGQGSTIAAAHGAVTVKTTGDLVNRGGTIQGEAKSASDVASVGAVTLDVAGSFLNESPDTSFPGAIFGANGDVAIRSGGDFTNRGGRIISNKGLTIRAGGNLANLVDAPISGNGGTRTDFHGSKRELLLFSRSRSGFDVNYGSLPVPRQAAYLVADGDMTLAGRNVSNLGGEIYANGGSLRVLATERFANQALASGSVRFERKCLIVCKTSAAADVIVTGGLVSAAQDLAINAGIEASNIGGRVLALGDMKITAPKVLAKGITGYTTLARDRGLKAWFGDTWQQIYAADVGGSFVASRGRLTVNGTLYLDGGEAAGGIGTDVSDGTVVVRSRQRDPVVISNHLGLTSWIGF